MSFTSTSIVQVSGTFTDITEVVPIDPPTVTLKVKNSAGTTTYVYGSDSNFIVRDSIGVYHANLDTTGITGVWTYQWQGSGNVGQSISSNTFVVKAPAIA